MNPEEPEYFLFVGSVDSESATTKLRASGASYRKKLLSSKAENWEKIVEMTRSPRCRGALVVLTGNDYQTMCHPQYETAGGALLEALAARPHIVLIHEAVFLTEEQREPAYGQATDPVERIDQGLNSNEDDPFSRTANDIFFRPISNEVRESVNKRLREHQLNVYPYRTNVERSVIASSFIDDNERHLLFRVYLPSGRLYAEEAEVLLGLFRDWLGQIGHHRIRQEGYSTHAGQVFEFFSAEGQPEGGLSRYIADFSSFLEDCVARPEAAITRLCDRGLAESAAVTIAKRFGIRARRLTLDLKQRREERILSLKHELENLVLEVDGVEGGDLMTLLDELLPPPAANGIIEGSATTPAPSITVNNFSPQFINEVAGSVVQSVGGTVHLGFEANQLLDLAANYGGHDRTQLETAVHELEDEGARGVDRVAARSRLKRFLADLGNRGLGVGLDVLQKYVEHKIGIS